ncbi:MAG: hypothetical protein HS122_10010 [Opitutaceae bacterium]|nr:hypothetical protein [Opitutaceae bacterium]
MKRLRQFFFERQLREKVLLLAFVLLGVAIWCSNLSDRVALQAREIKLTSMELDMQQGWLSRKAKIEADAKAALESWDPKKTFSAVKLNSELSSIAANVGIRSGYSIEAVPTNKSGGFGTIHTVRFIARRVDFGVLDSFYQEVIKRAPYIGLESVTLAADRSNPHQLNANFLVTSVELAR